MPDAALLEVDSLEEGITALGAGDYGLANSVFSRQSRELRARASRVARGSAELEHRHRRCLFGAAFWGRGEERERSTRRGPLHAVLQLPRRESGDRPARPPCGLPRLSSEVTHTILMGDPDALLRRGWRQSTHTRPLRPQEKSRPRACKAPVGTLARAAARAGAARPCHSPRPRAPRPGVPRERGLPQRGRVHPLEPHPDPARGSSPPTGG